MRLAGELQSLGFVLDGAVRIERSYYDHSDMPERQRLRCCDWYASIGERWVNFYRRGENNSPKNVRRFDRRERDKIIAAAREIASAAPRDRD